MGFQEKTLTLTSSQIESLGYIFDLAYGDQESYLNNGSPSIDYGDDWPLVSREKAKHFRAIAKVAARIGLHGESDRWNALAIQVQS